MSSGHGVVCLLVGHDYEYETSFSPLGRHVELKVCSRCGEEKEAFTGPIFPGEAEDPDDAVDYIERYTDREPPTPDSPIWSWEDSPVDAQHDELVSGDEAVPDEFIAEAEQLVEEMNDDD